MRKTTLSVQEFFDNRPTSGPTEHVWREIYDAHGERGCGTFLKHVINQPLVDSVRLLGGALALHNDPSCDFRWSTMKLNVLYCRLLEGLQDRKKKNVRIPCFEEILRNKMDEHIGYDPHVLLENYVKKSQENHPGFLKGLQARQVLMEAAHQTGLLPILTKHLSHNPSLPSALVWFGWAINAIRHPHALTVIDHLDASSRANILIAGRGMGEFSLVCEMSYKCNALDEVHQLISMWPELACALIDRSTGIIKDHLEQSENLFSKNLVNLSGAFGGEDRMMTMFKNTMTEVHVNVILAVESCMTDQQCHDLVEICKPHLKHLKGTVPHQWMVRADRAVLEDSLAHAQPKPTPSKRM